MTANHKEFWKLVTVRKKRKELYRAVGKAGIIAKYVQRSNAILPAL